MKLDTFRILFLFPVLVAAACSPAEDSAAPAEPTAAPAASDKLSARIVDEDLGEATPVAAARALGAGDQAVVVGRIADVVDGFAAFTLMDTGVPYCGEQSPEDNCDTPWDYCCESPEDKRANSLLVEIRGDDGRPLTSADLPGLRLLDLVQAEGRLAIDDAGNPVLIAARVHRTERPTLPAYVEWPR